MNSDVNSIQFRLFVINKKDIPVPNVRCIHRRLFVLHFPHPPILRYAWVSNCKWNKVLLWVVPVIPISGCFRMDLGMPWGLGSVFQSRCLKHFYDLYFLVLYGSRNISGRWEKTDDEYNNGVMWIMMMMMMMMMRTISQLINQSIAY